MLPTLSSPSYPLKLPSGKQVTARQFLAGEYKALLSAFTLGDSKVVHQTLVDVLKACVSTPIDFDANALSFHDVEWLFIALYGLSVDSTLSLAATCSGEHEDGDVCTFSVSVPVSEIQATPSDAEALVMVDESRGIRLKYPTFGEWSTLSTSSSLYPFVECVFDGERVYAPTDFSEQELEEWVNGLPQSVVDKIVVFIEAAPVIEWKREVTCPKCGLKSTLHYRGLDDFFVSSLMQKRLTNGIVQSSS